MPMEKQNTVENQLAHMITQTEFDSDYDKTAKKLLANKQILAQIMKGCVDEYSECSVDEIAVYLQLYRKYKILVCKGIYNYIVNKEKFTVQIVFV